jgi:putative addiction module component (TIGR02574 family)
MTAAIRRVLQAAMKLPISARVELVDELIATLDRADRRELSALWKKEIRRRSREIDAGTAELIPWSEIEVELKKRARARG